tara:strand:+ start:177 stop:728 length:552 start_codon:yes stop_codon:yes gene_type:complete
MSNLSKGRAVSAKDQVAGVRKVYFVNYGDPVVAYDGTDTDMIDDLGAITLYEYDLKDGNGSYTEAVQQTPENGTTFFEQTLEVSFPKLTKEDHKELKIMAYGRPHIIVLDHNDNLLIMGLLHGCDTTGGGMETGSAPGDYSGYRYTFTAKEKIPANFLKATAGTSASAYPFDNLTTAVTVTAS